MIEWEPKVDTPNLFASGAASPARRLQILRRRVHLGQVPQRGGDVVVMRVILAKKMH
jgi:hypothetical protein